MKIYFSNEFDRLKKKSRRGKIYMLPYFLVNSERSIARSIFLQRFHEYAKIKVIAASTD